MKSENCQKIKLLKLYEMLKQETDEQNPMTTMTIVDRLTQMGISCERRTVTKDMAILNEQGYEIMSRWVGKEKGYYVEDRSFSVPELKLLIDAVQAASFVTNKKTSELIDKLANLAGSHRADVLKDNIVCFNTRKHSNERILYSIGDLEDAIQRNKKVIFKYFDLDENGEKVFRRDGHHYVVEPIALVFHEDNYYLMIYSSRHGNTANYRVDRMESVKVVDDDITETAISLRDSIAGYTEQAFKMYGGTPEEITIQFDNGVLGAVYDKFGETLKITKLSDGRFETTVTIQISPTFWGWIFQFGNQMRVIAPQTIVNKYQEIISQLSGEQNYG